MAENIQTNQIAQTEQNDLQVTDKPQDKVNH